MSEKEESYVQWPFPHICKSLLNIFFSFFKIISLFIFNLSSKRYWKESDFNTLEKQCFENEIRENALIFITSSVYLKFTNQRFTININLSYLSYKNTHYNSNWMRKDEVSAVYIAIGRFNEEEAPFKYCQIFQFFSFRFFIVSGFTNLGNYERELTNKFFNNCATSA